MKKILAFVFLFLIFCECGVYGINFYKNDINSESVYVINKNSMVPIIEKNTKQRRSPASLTKIMTYIVACENIKDVSNYKIKVCQDVLDMVDPESSGCKLKDGEEFTALELFHCMMICSSGYAAMVIADYAGGGIENFVDLMNQKAQSLGCNDTHFKNPDGIYDSEQYTTAEDMYKITKYAMNLPEFLNITGKAEYNLFNDNRDPIVTTNKMIDKKRGGEYYLPIVKGIKTGYLEQAGRCLVSYAEKNGETYVAVVMGGPVKDKNGAKIEKNMAMVDTKNIYLWIFENLVSAKLFSKDSPLKEIALKYVWNHDKLLLSPQSDFYFSLPKNFSKDDIYVRFEIPDSVEAPVEAGDMMGTAEIFYKNEKIGDMNLVSGQTFKKNYLLVFNSFICGIFLSPISIMVFSLIMLFLVFYIFSFFRGNKKRKRRKGNVRVFYGSGNRKKY